MATSEGARATRQSLLPLVLAALLLLGAHPAAAQDDLSQDGPQDWEPKEEFDSQEIPRHSGGAGVRGVGVAGEKAVDAVQQRLKREQQQRLAEREQEIAQREEEQRDEEEEDAQLLQDLEDEEAQQEQQQEQRQEQQDFFQLDPEQQGQQQEQRQEQKDFFKLDPEQQEEQKGPEQQEQQEDNDPEQQEQQDNDPEQQQEQQEENDPEQEQQEEEEEEEEPPPPPQEPAARPRDWSHVTADDGRRDAVREAIAHAWDMYDKYAWGRDELAPVSRSGKTTFGNLGATIIDSIDTLWMAGLEDRAAKATEWALSELSFNNTKVCISLFETNIRVVGGLLAAADITGNQEFVNRTIDLVDRMLYYFDTPSGVPCNQACFHRPSYRQSCSSVSIAEVGTYFLEFHALSDRSGDPKYGAAVNRIQDFLLRLHPEGGLMPWVVPIPTVGPPIPQTWWDTVLPNAHHGHYVVGAMADSYYEYLLKMWLMEGCQGGDLWRQQWEATIDDLLATALFQSASKRLAYIFEPTFRETGKPGSRGEFYVKKEQEHLACFLPGNIALGVLTGAVTGRKRAAYAVAAHKLTIGCRNMYQHMNTGLSGERITVRKMDDLVNFRGQNLLRPEVVESYFYMWRLTGNRKYRTWGWEMFQAFERHSRVHGGYTGLENVQHDPLSSDSPDADGSVPKGDRYDYTDTMESFFMAETLKYLYLLFSDDSALPLDKWVMNTEAHPLRMKPGCSISTYRSPAARRRLGL